MTASPLASRPVKPRFRGWIHLWSFVCSLAAGVTLVTVAAGTVSGVAALATAVYSATICGLFGVSALYHRRDWTSPRAQQWVRRLDHSMSSGRRESHPPALADPGVNLSAHRARVIRLWPLLFSFAVPISSGRGVLVGTS